MFMNTEAPVVAAGDSLIGADLYLIHRVRA
jgi:hypothetical protein